MNGVTDEELKGLFDAMGHDNAAAHEATRRHVDVVNEATRHEVQLLAETVSHFIERFDNSVAALNEKIEQTAAETQAMFKFSHAELEKRMRTLEESNRTLASRQTSIDETLSDLQARVERLESSTH